MKNNKRNLDKASIATTQNSKKNKCDTLEIVLLQTMIAEREQNTDNLQKEVQTLQTELALTGQLLEHSTNVANLQKEKKDLTNELLSLKTKNLCIAIISAAQSKLNNSNSDLDNLLKVSTSNSINVVLEGMKTFLTNTASLYGVNLSNFGVNLQPSKQLEEIQKKFTLDLNSFVFTR